MTYPDIAAGILVGGAGSRMGGRDKAQLHRPDGRTFLETILAELRGHIAIPWLLAGADGYPLAPPGVAVLSDIIPGSGPLGGLATALSALRDGDTMSLCPRGASGLAPTWCFLVACDLGRFEVELLHRLAAARSPEADAVVAAAEQRVHPTCALYHRRLASRALAAVRSGERSLLAFLRGVKTQTVRIDSTLAQALANINSPEDLERMSV